MRARAFWKAGCSSSFRSNWATPLRTKADRDGNFGRSAYWFIAAPSHLFGIGGHQ